MHMNSGNAIALGLFLFPAMSVSCQPTEANKSNPNIILILSDDMGYSDIGCYGGETQTPNLDALASEGVRFSQFYNAARCCPTRASLLTGLYPHQAGVGYMTAKLGQSEAYQGHIKKDVQTIAGYLKDRGYTTLHVGKWHVGGPENNTMPCDKDFDKAWAPVGRVNYWNTEKVYENGQIRPVNSEEQKYLTDIEGDKALEYIQYADTKEQPFFMYLAFNAAHWPLHAKPKDIARYRGKFRKGWNTLQKERIHRLDSIGLVNAVDPFMVKDPSVPDWGSIPENDKYPGYHAVTSPQHDQDDWDLKMAVYAAQIDCMDQNIGRIISKLKELGEFENTLILFLQDNGACAEGIGKNEPYVPGTPESYVAYGLPWADLGNTPFKMYKHFLHEGGISTPFIIYWPNGIDDHRKGTIEKESFGHLIDVIPTCLDAAGVKNLQDFPSLEGQSLLEVINGKAENSGRQIFWEHEGNRAVRKGDWKLVSRYSDDYRYFNAWGWEKEPRTEEWELYNIREDRWEFNDVSAEHPELVNEMKNEFLHWGEQVGVIPRKEIIKGSKFKM